MKVRTNSYAAALAQAIGVPTENCIGAELKMSPGVVEIVVTFQATPKMLADAAHYVGIREAQDGL